MEHFEVKIFLPAFCALAIAADEIRRSATTRVRFILSTLANFASCTTLNNTDELCLFKPGWNSGVAWQSSQQSAFSAQQSAVSVPHLVTSVPVTQDG
jgi:hypothetical protein